ncbi:MAG: complex I NDUFA9 subunit family protein [Alphaproteobacteria bacterium]|nr:complex I NDUFA9 subunit family protein [Alphaproteobacteria bacterium]
MSAQVATVFGGSGFIGRYVVRRLAKAGYRVNVAVRDVERAKFLRPLGDVGQITAIPTTVTDRDQVARAIDSADVVVNLIGILYEGGGNSFAGVQAEGPKLIAEEAAKAGATRLVQVSAIGASATSPSDYARSKAAGEKAVLEAFPDATILRPSVVFGPEDGFFNRFASIARMSPVLPLFGGGTTKFQPVYVGDVADAVMKGLTDPETRGKTYELGGPRVYTFKELMEIVCKETKRKKVLLPLPYAAGDLQATFMELLPHPPLTRDQMKLLRRDNVVTPDGVGTLADLGIEATSVEAIVPSYLDRFRPGGRFNSVET